MSCEMRPITVAFILLRFVFIGGLMVVSGLLIRAGCKRPMDILKNLVDGFSGKYGSYLAIAIYCANLTSELGRHLNRWFTLQRIVEDYIFSPLFLSSAATLMVLGNSADSSLRHQLLAVIIFLKAQLDRFSFSTKDAALLTRALCRLNEYIFYWSSLQLNHIWTCSFFIPALILVSACRTHEIFLIWREQEAKSGLSDRSDQAEEGMKRLDSILVSAGYTDFRTSGICKQLFRSPNQHCLLWDQGSGVLLFVVFSVLGSAGAMILKSSETLEWKVSFCALFSALTVLLVLRILPGLFVRLDRAFEHIKEDRPLAEILQLSWFYEIKLFLQVLVVKGLPVEEGSSEFDSLWKISKLEGIELIVYVVVFALARALARGCLACFMLLLQITRMGIKMEPLWCRWRTNLASFVANLSIKDIMSTMTIIGDAEGALAIRKSCSCSQCIKLTKGVLIEMLQKAMEGYDASTAIGLFQSIQDTLKGTNVETLGPLGALLNLLDKSTIGPTAIGPTWKMHQPEVAHAVATEMEHFCEKLWRPSLGPCMEDKDWIIMKAQF